MNAVELVQKITRLIAKHGDIPCVESDGGGCYRNINEAKIVSLLLAVRQEAECGEHDLAEPGDRRGRRCIVIGY